MPTYISARLDHDRPTTDPTFDGFMEIVHIHDRVRIYGDLYHHVAINPTMAGILVYQADSHQSRVGLDKAFFDQADESDDHPWSVWFHVSLEYKSGSDMTGGLRLYFRCEPGKTPRYLGYDINT